MRYPIDGDLPFLHGLEQGGLGPWRGPVDLVSQENADKDGPRPELELVGPLVVYTDTGNVVGQEIGRTLQPVKAHP